MKNKVILIKYADGDEYRLTIEYFENVAAARKRASELVKECEDQNGESVDTMSIDNNKLRAVLTDGTMIWISWNEMIDGGSTFVYFSSNNFGDILDFKTLDDAVAHLMYVYGKDYNKYAETIVSAELCTRPFEEHPIGEIAKGGYYGYIICRNEDVDMYYKIINHE